MDWTRDITVMAASVAAILGMRELVKTIWHGIRETISAAVDHSDTGKLVKYHLGPNGTTPPIHVRLKRLEKAHNIYDIEESDHESPEPS